MSEAPVPLSQLWGPVRAALSEFSASEIRTLIGASGVAVDNVTSLIPADQRTSSYKQPFLQAADCWMSRQDDERRARIIARCVEEMIRAKPSCQPRLEEVLMPQGWGVTAGHLVALHLQVTVEVADLPEAVRKGLMDAIARYRVGDTDGALTSICGSVDSLTETIYAANPSLGDHQKEKYQERVAKAFADLENGFVAGLVASGCPADEASLIWKNLRGSVNHAAFVLSRFRSRYADVHGTHDSPAVLVQAALDCATYIIRSIVG